MNYTKRRLFGLNLLVLIVLIFSLSVHAADPINRDQNAADINGTGISMRDLNNEYRQALKRKGTSENDISVEQALVLKKELLNSLIDQELLYQESKKKNIVVDEALVADSVAKVKEKFETEDAFQKAMMDANLKVDDLEKRVLQSLAINIFVEEQISQKLFVTDEESRQYYDTHPDNFQEPEKIRASHILIKVDEDAGESTKDAAKEKITTIQQKIKEGEDFEQLARDNSDCPSSANGGDLGYFRKGAMVKEFEDAAFVLTPDAVSGIVETQFGYHLIKVLDRKEGSTISYDAVKSDLQDFLKRKKRSEEVLSLLESLRKSATIEEYL